MGKSDEALGDERSPIAVASFIKTSPDQRNGKLPTAADDARRDGSGRQGRGGGGDGIVGHGEIPFFKGCH